MSIICMTQSKHTSFTAVSFFNNYKAGMYFTRLGDEKAYGPPCISVGVFVYINDTISHRTDFTTN